MVNVVENNLISDYKNIVNNVKNNNEIIEVSSDSGNYYIINKDEYDNIIETLSIMKNENYYNDLLKKMKAPIEDFIDESELKF